MSIGYFGRSEQEELDELMSMTWVLPCEGYPVITKIREPEMKKMLFFQSEMIDLFSFWTFVL